LFRQQHQFFLRLELSLGYLQSIVERRRSNAACFAAITVLDHHDAEFLVPHIFLCNGWLNRRLKRLRLRPPTSSFAKSVGQFLRRTHFSSEFAAAQDRITPPGDVRVFLAHRHAPGKHIVALPSLVQMLAAASRVASVD
ncbi:MAG TPA: hypothetical protein PK867_31715, partial [Pirellulales bacterium]|nr:hypothetical protein [Pirellulales bacterium]